LITNNKFIVAAFLLLCAGLAQAETLTYRQFKDVAVKENGGVSQSGDKNDLFEMTFSIDKAHKTVTRTRVRRLDEAAAHNDNTVYTVTQKQFLPGSDAGNGGKVLIAVRKDGGEILELGHRFAFTMRVSPFSQVISGVYKRVYDKGRKHSFHRHDHNKQ